MHYTNNSGLFHQESNGVLISIINDKWQRSIGGLVLGDDKLVDAQVSGCQGGLFGCHPSCFHSGTVHYSPCEMPLYIAWYCEHGELNNATTTTQGLLLYPQSRGQVARRGLGVVGERAGVGIVSCSCADQNRSRVSRYLRGNRGHMTQSPVQGECFLLGFLGLATSLASLRVSLPTEPLIKRGFV